MKKSFVLDASALIAFLGDERGAEKVEEILRKAGENKIFLYMNKINVLEVYYGVYREDGKKKAEETLLKIQGLPIKITDILSGDIFKEAGRFKAKYKISLADSIAIADAKTKDAFLITADHHEFDIIDRKREAELYWIR